MAQVSYRLPDFTGPDGTEYTEIEVVVEADDLHEAVKLAGKLEKPLARKEDNNGTKHPPGTR